MADEEDKSPLLVRPYPRLDILPGNLTYYEYIESLSTLGGIAKRVYEEEKAVLNSGLKAFDFSAAAASLRECVSEVLELREFYILDLEHKKEGQSNLDKGFEALAKRDGNFHFVRFWAIEATAEYITSLVMAASAMIDLTERLDAKAKGEKFGFFEYRRLYKEHKQLDKIRHQASKQFKTACKHKW